MTKTTRAIVGTAALGAACGLMLAVVGEAKAATPVYCEPDVLCSVLKESAVVGWPHPMTQPELRAIVYRTARAYRATAVTCHAGYWVYEPIVCGVKAPRYRSGNPFRVRVLVWEDGSYRITEIRPAKPRRR